MSRAVMQQALEALEGLADYRYTERVKQALVALKQALAEPEQKVWCDCGDSIEPDSGAKCGNCVASDSAEPEQEPVAWMWRCKPFCNWPEWNVSLKRPADSGRDGNKRTEGYEDVPLYTAPIPRKPLTDDEIALIVGECAASAHRYGDFSFARAIIAAYEAKQGEQT